MIGHELAVEQREPAEPQPRHQPGDRHLRRIGPSRHHRFAEKRPPQRHPVQPADQFVPVPAFDRMGKTNLVQMPIGPLDRPVDPGRRPVGRSLRTQRDHPREIAIGRHRKPLLPDHLRQRMRQMKPIERQDRPLLRLHPIDILRRAVVRHRKHPDAIGLQQHQRIDHHPRQLRARSFRRATPNRRFDRYSSAMQCVENVRAEAQSHQ